MQKSTNIFFAIAATVSIFTAGWLSGAEYTKRHMAEALIQSICENTDKIFHSLLNSMTETEDEIIARTERDITNYRASKKLWDAEAEKVEKEFDEAMKKLKEWERKEIEEIDNIMKEW